MRREAVSELGRQKEARILAVLSNGGYLQTDEGMRARAQEIQELESAFDEIVASIMEPEVEVDLANNQFFAAGARAMDKLRWDLGVAGAEG